ncbi:hypothetical protein G4B88_015618 [Cannabis sativa]|uniref:Aldose 1-epimerase n=1 Tax=Cannabis sativa TaxID=3483 RepID=A0A7J6H816_CANSA|nr:hypothetical protein G4B88_015618 [Cannabis sativa]
MTKTTFLLCFITLLASSSALPSVSKHHKVGFYELKKGHISVNLTNWGATIVSLHLPDRHGKLDDVVLGYDSIDTYKLVEDVKTSFSGGKVGFSDVAWKVKSYQNKGLAPHIVFTYHSRDGEQGFPGDVLVTATYTLFGHGKLAVIMTAKALNKPTPVNLAQHTYWNLGGHTSGDILSNDIQIFGSQITPVDDELIPTGKIQSVKGTPFDFLKPHPVGTKIKELPKGYDINYVLDGVPEGKELKRVAVVYDKKSGRSMDLSTNKPGVQFYTGNNIKDIKGKGGFVYQSHAALCLETQAFPDSVNHPNFPSTIISPEEPYKHVMLFKFSTKDRPNFSSV